MEKPKFTPGPWSVHVHSHIAGDQWLSVLCGAWDITHGYAADPGVVASAGHSAMSEAENLANAQLIAAAPDHHANAVEFDRLCLVIESAVRNADPSNIEAVVALIKANRAALSKANGEGGA